MTPRDLAYQALAHRPPERIPWTLYLAKPLCDKLTARWGPREHWPCPPDDIVRILWPVETHDVRPEGFRDRFGVSWRREHGGYIFTDPPLAEPDVKKIPRVSLVSDEEVRQIRDTRAHHPDPFIFYQFTATLGERLWCLRGLEQAMMDFHLEPDFVHGALDVLLEMHMQALDKVLPLPIDGVTIGDDFGTQRGLMIGRDTFLTFFKPRLRTLYDRIRAAGKVVMHHSCGDNTALLGDFVDLGLEVFHPLQPECMDIAVVKRDFGRHLTFRGGIGTQGAIVLGTPDAARAEVRAAVRILGDSGGYFLETAKPLPEETPVENAVAVIEEMARVMNYRF